MITRELDGQYMARGNILWGRHRGHVSTMCIEEVYRLYADRCVNMDIDMCIDVWMDMGHMHPAKACVETCM